MKAVDYLIVGGGAAGTTAADVIRSLKPEASITIITDELHEFYSRVLIPHYIRHKVTRDHVFLKTPDWYMQRKIELIKGVKAERLESGNKQVKANNGEIYQYGKLLISVGGKVIPFKAPGANLQNILYMRTVDDADRIIKVASQSRKAVVVGGGFIGLEFASCFKANGIEDVTVLVIEPYYWFGKLDEQSSRVLVGTLEKNGIKVFMEEEVDRFESASAASFDKTTEVKKATDGQGDQVGVVVTKTGNRYEAQAVGIGIGIRADLDWLKESGIAISRGIVTNEFLETNLPDVYAAGDCAEFKDLVFERQHMLGNWANATNQGSAVGRTLAGTRTVFETASSYTINFFDPPLGKAGGSCSFIGVTDEKFADEVIMRGSVELGKMTRIFIKTIGGVMRIVGATVINNAGEVALLTAAVKGKVDVSSNKDKLSDISFNLMELVKP